MKTRWGCRRSCWSQGKVDWPAASHVLIKRLTARTMLMFRNDLVSTRGPPSSPNFLYRSIFFPFPESTTKQQARALFPSSASTFLSFITLGHAKVMFLRAINFHRNSPLPPNLPTFGERITPIFRWRKKMAWKKFSSALQRYEKIPPFPQQHSFSSGEGISRTSSFLSLFIFNDYITTRWFDEIKRRRQRIGNQACVNSSRTR